MGISVMRARTRTEWYGVHAHAERVVSSVTLVAEHHLVLVVGLLAHGARLALHALPAVCLDDAHQVLAHVQARRVTCSPAQP